jgi:[protein-PII] uridylyltransferase
VATRRDLDDPATIHRVGEAVGCGPRLQLLAALTEADSKATGPSAWGSWKAELLALLVDRVAHVLAGGDISDVPSESFPTGDHLARMLESEDRIEGRDQVLTVVTEDHPGVFSRIAGVLALHGLDVLRASAYSSEQGRALAEFHVSDPIRSQVPWGRVVADLELVLDGRLALSARLAERAQTYARNRPPSSRPAAGAAIAVAVRFDNQASDGATVIDVHTPDRIGALYRITRAFSELDLDIRSARVETLGAQVVDSFYVRDRHGAKVTDKHALAEIERAVVHSLADGPTA